MIMMRIFMAFYLTVLFACNEETKKSSVQVATKKHLTSVSDEKIYRFDSSSFVSGCADVYFQKVSKDLQYELKIALDFDRIPKLKEIDINKYSKFIKIELSIYDKENKYVDPICNDAPRFPKDWKAPRKYLAISGTLTITYWSDKDHIVSAITRTLVLQSPTNDKISLPGETFNKLRVHTYGG
jgi:hypothetical protein